MGEVPPITLTQGIPKLPLVQVEALPGSCSMFFGKINTTVVVSTGYRSPQPVPHYVGGLIL